MLESSVRYHDLEYGKCYFRIIKPTYDSLDNEKLHHMFINVYISSMNTHIRAIIEDDDV